MLAWILHILPSNGKQGPAVLANKKQEKFDHIGADNIIRQSGVRISRKKYKDIFLLRLKI
jgi:hypothetical protein